MWTLICDRLYSRHRADTVVKWIKFHLLLVTYSYFWSSVHISSFPIDLRVVKLSIFASSLTAEDLKFEIMVRLADLRIFAVYCNTIEVDFWVNYGLIQSDTKCGDGIWSSLKQASEASAKYTNVKKSTSIVLHKLDSLHSSIGAGSTRISVILAPMGHDIKLHPHRMKLYRIGCVGSGLVSAKALT